MRVKCLPLTLPSRNHCQVITLQPKGWDVTDFDMHENGIFSLDLAARKKTYRIMINLDLLNNQIILIQGNIYRIYMQSLKKGEILYKFIWNKDDWTFFSKKLSHVFIIYVIAAQWCFVRALVLQSWVSSAMVVLKQYYHVKASQYAWTAFSCLYVGLILVKIKIKNIIRCGVKDSLPRTGFSKSFMAMLKLRSLLRQASR